MKMTEPQRNTIRDSDIAELAAWLNRSLGEGPEQMAVQLIKVSAELGEACDAWAAHTGQDPWKPPVPVEAVLEELADTAIAALVGIARVGGDPVALVNAKLAAVLPRCGSNSGRDYIDDNV